MPKRFKIDCIVTRDHYDPHAQISHIGGPLGKMGRYKRTIEEVIAEIEQQLAEYFVTRHGHEEMLTVIESRWGNKYLGSRGNPHTLEDLLICRSNGRETEANDICAADDIENRFDTQETGSAEPLRPQY